MDIISLLCKYRAYHTKKGTLITHLIGVPMVTFSALVLFSFITLNIANHFVMDFNWIAFIVLSLLYLRLKFSWGLAASLLLLGLTLLSTYFSSFWVFLVSFVIGWAIQLLGHAIEGRKPALLDSFWESLFIAPLFIVAEVFFLCGKDKDFPQS
jgi:uncharacterized membrane protein YGL010W